MTCQSNVAAVEKGRQNAEACIGGGLGGAGRGPSAKSAGTGMSLNWKGGGGHTGTDQLKTESASVKSRRKESRKEELEGKEEVKGVTKEVSVMKKAFVKKKG